MFRIISLVLSFFLVASRNEYPGERKTSEQAHIIDDQDMMACAAWAMSMVVHAGGVRVVYLDGHIWTDCLDEYTLRFGPSVYARIYGI